MAPGTPLVQLDAEKAEAGPAHGRIAFSSAVACRPAQPREQALANLEAMRRLVLGFDADPAETATLAVEYVRLAREWAGDERRRLEDEILGIFADLAALCRRQASPEEDDELGPTSAGEYFLSYLRTLDAEAGPLPQRFLECLKRAVAHYGLESLERTPALLDVLFWVFKAQRRLDAATEVMLAILQRRIEDPGPQADPAFAALLDQLVAASEGRRPSLCDMAREMRYRLFDQPLYEARRKEVYAETEARLETLRGQPGTAEREALIETLVACPQPLQRLISARLEGETPAMRERLLEILVRRYYRIRNLEELRVWRDGDRALARAAYTLKGRRACLLSTHARADELEPALRSLLPHVATVPADVDVVLDLYLWSEGPLPQPSENAAATRATLDAVLGGRSLHRVSVTLGAPGNGQWQSALQYFTFRCGPEGFREDLLYRGFHTMIAKRLRLARLAEFELERLPSVEDVYVFRGVARRTRRTSGSSGWPRCATRPRCAMPPGASSRCRTSSACSWRCWPRSGCSRATAGPRSACTGTGSCSTSGRPCSSAGTRSWP